MYRIATSSIFALLLAVFSSSAPAQSSGIETEFAKLLVAAETPAGYNRSFFGEWIDEDRNGCSARFEVLISEAVVKPSVGARCKLTGGKWISIFDNQEFTNASLLDVDHFVPLAEAWRSGANLWTGEQRIAFANDLKLPDALIAVSRTSNRSKSDRDVANWLPPNREYRCSYLVSWVKVKAKWNLRMDATERQALETGLINCGELTKRTAAKFAPNSNGATPKLQPSVVRFQNCTFAKAAGVTPIRRSSNSALYDANKHLDRDKDGVACE
jgi:hypothetical protein